MPKERFHLLVADQTLHLWKSTAGGEVVPAPYESVFLLGSMLPDLFFYDFPRFTLARVGNRLHRCQGEAALDCCRRWLGLPAAASSPAGRALALGLACHLLTDGLVHPVIDRLSHDSNGVCSIHRLSPRDCHHWLESELEAYWLTLAGPGHGYLPLLRRWRRDNAWSIGHIRCYRLFLRETIDLDMPGETRMLRCFQAQSRLLRWFAYPRWDRLRPRLLKHRAGKYLGSLLVPARPQLPEILEQARSIPGTGRSGDEDAARRDVKAGSGAVTAGSGNTHAGRTGDHITDTAEVTGDLCSGRFLAGTVAVIADRLRAL